MVRCIRCKKSFTRGRGESWEDDMCNKCWLFGDPLEQYFPPIQNTRRLTIELDRYLDLYTWHEIRLLTGNN